MKINNLILAVLAVLLIGGLAIAGKNDAQALNMPKKEFVSRDKLILLLIREKVSINKEYLNEFRELARRYALPALLAPTSQYVSNEYGDFWKKTYKSANDLNVAKSLSIVEFGSHTSVTPQTFLLCHYQNSYLTKLLAIEAIPSMLLGSKWIWPKYQLNKLDGSGRVELLVAGQKILLDPGKRWQGKTTLDKYGSIDTEILNAGWFSKKNITYTTHGIR